MYFSISPVSSCTAHSSCVLEKKQKKFAINETRGERFDLDLVPVSAQREKKELTGRAGEFLHVVSR